MKGTKVSAGGNGYEFLGNLGSDLREFTSFTVDIYTSLMPCQDGSLMTRNAPGRTFLGTDVYIWVQNLDMTLLSQDFSGNDVNARSARLDVLLLKRPKFAYRQ